MGKIKKERKDKLEIVNNNVIENFKRSKMLPEIKKWIDNASYEELLRKWRFAPSGSPFFQGEAGKYYSKIMKERRQQIGNAEQVTASKSIGWDN